MSEKEKVKTFIIEQLNRHINHCIQFIHDGHQNNFGQILRYTEQDCIFNLYIKKTNVNFPIIILNNQIVKCLTCEHKSNRPWESENSDSPA